MRITERFSNLAECYAYLDPASGTTEQKKSSQARSAIAVIALDTMARCYLRYCWAERVPPDQILEKVIEVQLTFHPQIFGIESTAQQTLFAGLVDHECLKRGVTINIFYDKGRIAHTSKNERIRNAIQPLVKAGRFFLLEDGSQLKAEQEIKTFPSGLTMDIVDACAGAINLIPPRRLHLHKQHAKLTQAIRNYKQLAGITSQDQHTPPWQQELERRRQQSLQDHRF